MGLTLTAISTSPRRPQAPLLIHLVSSPPQYFRSSGTKGCGRNFFFFLHKGAGRDVVTRKGGEQRCQLGTKSLALFFLKNNNNNKECYLHTIDKGLCACVLEERFKMRCLEEQRWT